MKSCFYLAALFLVEITANILPRVYENPLSNKVVDLFFVVDETNMYMNQLQLGQIKIALIDVATELQPSGSNPYFGVFFYGATTSVKTVVSFPASSAATVKSALDNQQYSPTQSSPSTLSAALNSVRTACQSYCRANVTRVTVIFTANPDILAESTARQIESGNDVTVIAVGIGPLAFTSSLEKLSSKPSHAYVMSFSSFGELAISGPHISWVVSNVPRVLRKGLTLSIFSGTNGVYFPVQLNTAGYIGNNNTLITFTTNCGFCSIYTSLVEPTPISTNAKQSLNSINVYTSSYTYAVHYFRAPINTNRLFLSIRGNGMSSVTGVYDIIAIPQMM